MGRGVTHSLVLLGSTVAIGGVAFPKGNHVFLYVVLRCAIFLSLVLECSSLSLSLLSLSSLCAWRMVSTGKAWKRQHTFVEEDSTFCRNVLKAQIPATTNSTLEVWMHAVQR
ncbi:hypothetical protein ACFX15_004386 [Malus domestica]